MQPQATETGQQAAANLSQPKSVAANQNRYNKAIEEKHKWEQVHNNLFGLFFQVGGS